MLNITIIARSVYCIEIETHQQMYIIYENENLRRIWNICNGANEVLYDSDVWRNGEKPSPLNEARMNDIIYFADSSEIERKYLPHLVSIEIYNEKMKMHKIEASLHLGH